MYAQVEKPKENTSPAGRQESSAVGNSVAQKKSNGKQGFGFVDNRPEAKQAAQVQAIMNQKSGIESLSTDTVQLRKIDVVASGITHLVRLNEHGSLYQENFMQNEVAETRAGDSVVIETDNRVRSRRGPHQEQDPSRDKEAESDHIWTNALDLNDEELPQHTFIRDGTFIERRSPKTVFNLASGTVPETLMHTDVEQQHVVNLDSGHMAVADAVFANINPEVIGSIVALLVQHNPKGQFGATKRLTIEERTMALNEQMTKSATLMTNLKQLLHVSFPGHAGVLAFIERMPRYVKETIRKNLAGLKDFQFGDLETGAEIARSRGTADVVHMVNAFGFDPIEDHGQVIHLATMLRSGGRLVITAETTGPTVSPLFRGYDGVLSPGAITAHISGIISRTALGIYFDLGPLTYPHGIPVSSGSRSDVMPRNAFTKSMDSTRHTMPSTSTTGMPESDTVQITFIRNLGKKGVKSLAS